MTLPLIMSKLSRTRLTHIYTHQLFQLFTLRSYEDFPHPVHAGGLHTWTLTIIKGVDKCGSGNVNLGYTSLDPCPKRTLTWPTPSKEN